MLNLRIGDKNQEGTIEIINEDSLCYIVKSTSRGATGIRTISKVLLEEFVAYENMHPEANANEMRDALSGKTDVDKFEYGYASTLLSMAKLNKVVRHKHLTVNFDYPLQQIFYGAPGTGKSHDIKEITGRMPAENVFRTTFHPDSDYSTFVGCYKPTMRKASSAVQKIVDYSTLVEVLSQRIGPRKDNPMPNITKECVTFGYEYHDSIVKIQENNAYTIPGLVSDAYKTGSTYDTQVRAGMAVYELFGSSTQSNDSITYSFVPQTFLKAYIRAYQTTEPVILIIEEINRGNCAQIFGDLFQLLDRNSDGVSEYPIKADQDLCVFLKGTLGSDSEGISNDELRLPNNLYIWATMNTSDQSLFPIDSAFKRRWDWKYMPIDSSKENWCIRVNNTDYSWTDFLDKINDIVREKTQSEDKQLGFYFCKAKDGVIDAETFVGKVLFYLWNDVFKDYGFDDEYFVDEKLSDGLFKPLAFRNFYDVKTRKVIETQAEKFLKNLDIIIEFK